MSKTSVQSIKYMKFAWSRSRVSQCPLRLRLQQKSPNSGSGSGSATLNNTTHSLIGLKVSEKNLYLWLRSNFSNPDREIINLQKVDNAGALVVHRMVPKEGMGELKLPFMVKGELFMFTWEQRLEL